MATTTITLTIRLIKSFEHRTIRYIVLKGVDPSITVKELMHTILQHVKAASNLPIPFKQHNYDTLKINSYAHGAKSNDTAIVLEHDEQWILTDHTHSLTQYRIENETELSFFNNEDYQKYKQNPQLLW